MRRPDPLPATPEQEDEPVSRPRTRRRKSTAPVGAVAGDVPAVPSVLKEAAKRGRQSATKEERTDQEAPEEQLTARDVWRTARARRKALRSEIRRFTQRSRRRRRTWLVVLAALVVLVGGSVAAAYSPLFAVEKITVVGTSSLDGAAVEQALSGQLGTPLAAIDTAEVKAALVAFPLIETYALEANPPHDLTVRIVERTPVGVIDSDAGFTLVDAAGVALSTTEEKPEGQPVLEIESGTESAAFEAAGLVVRSLPTDVRAAVTTVTASTADDVTLTLSGNVTIVWGSADQSVLKAKVLSTIMAVNPGASSYDVSSPSVPVVG